VSLDGENFTFSTGEGELDAMAWGDAEKRQLILLGLKRLRVAGLALDDSVGRVCNGDEGNNVKEYTFLGPGAAITKTNIGTSYVNICPGANGERILVDLTGCIQFRPFLTANLLATGPFQVRIVRDSDNTVFYESPSISQTGERELDPGWTDLPAGFSGQEILRVQAKSATATDDPVFRRITMLLK
jgi:hypothetical protein